MNKIRGRLLALVLCACAAMLAGTGLALNRYSEVGRETPPAPAASEPGDPEADVAQYPAQTLKEDRLNLLFCGLDESELFTDVIMLAQFDLTAGKVDILSIPRDIFVGAEYITGKINEVYSRPVYHKDGMTELKSVIEDQFGLPVDAYMVITLSSLRDMVDYFGGVEVRLDREIVCKPDQVLPEGLQLLNGERAEWLLRHRSSYQNADLGRINAQQIFLQAAFSTAKKAGKIKCLQAAVKYHGRLKTDLPLAKTMALAEAALNLGADDIQTFTVPVRGASYGTYSVVEVSRYSFAKLLSEHFSAGQTVTAEMLDTRYVPYVPPASSDAAQDDFQDPGEEPDDGWGDYAQLSPDEEESEGLIIHQP